MSTNKSGRVPKNQNQSWAKVHATKLWAGLAIVEALCIGGYFGYRSLQTPVDINLVSGGPCSEENIQKIELKRQTTEKSLVAPKTKPVKQISK